MGHIAADRWTDFSHTPDSRRLTRTEKNRDARSGRFSRRSRGGAQWESESETWRATVVLDGNLTCFGSFDSRAGATAASEAARHDLGALSEPEPGRTAQRALIAVAHGIRALEAVGVARVFRSSTRQR